MRYLVFDRTDHLTPAWRAGAVLYRKLGRIDDALGVASWDEALDWLASRDAIDELQYWGHGKWGAALVAKRDVFDASWLLPAHARARQLDAIRERLSPDALVWFRTCETFGATRGIAFAERLADRLGARVAGHTHVIGFHQSGGCALAPGQHAHWSPDDGLAAGTPDAPERARDSRPWRPRTITCLRGDVPASWFG